MSLLLGKEFRDITEKNLKNDTSQQTKKQSAMVT